jgi:hypothetical protein
MPGPKSSGIGRAPKCPVISFTAVDTARQRRFLALEGMKHALVLLKCGQATSEVENARKCLERAKRFRVKALLYCAGTHFTVSECGLFDWLSNSVDNCATTLEERVKKGGKSAVSGLLDLRA